MRLRNKGIGAIGAVMAISAVMVTAGLGSLYLSQMSRSQWLDSNRASIADDLNKQALTMTNILISDGEVALTPAGVLTMAHPAATTSMWTPVFSGGATPELTKMQFRFCDPRMTRPSVDGSVVDEASCPKLNTELSFQGLMPDKRPKVNVATSIDVSNTKKVSRSLTALVGAVSTLSNVPPPPPPPPPGPGGCTAGIKYATVTFEEFAGGAYLDAAMAAVLLRDYGVKITYLSNPSARLRVAQIVSRGDSDPGFDAWMSVRCPGRPNHNRICNGDPHGTGQRALSFSDGMSTRNITYQIEFTDPVSDFGFDMLDLDGGESWVVKAYDGATPPNLLVTRSISESSYGDGSGNNAVTAFSFPPRATRDIKRVVLVGTKSIKLFGTGVDNIRTGMAVCP